MNKNFESLVNKAKQMKLSLRDREILRARIENFVKDHPRRGPSTMYSDYSWFVFLSKHAVSVTIVCALFFTGTLSISAEGTAPGDVLYGVKTGVNEKVLGIFAISPDARAEWELSLAGRRLEEIATLSKKQRLTPKVKRELQDDVDFHTTLALGTSTDILSRREDSNGSDAITPVMATAVIRRIDERGGDKLVASFSGTEASTTISTDDIVTLQEKIASRKQNVKDQRLELKRAKTFVRNKAASLVAEKLTLEAEDARSDGDNEKAGKLIEEARAVLSHNPLPEPEVEVPNSSVIVSPTDDDDVRDQ